MASTDKISVSMGREELRDARRLASRLGLTLSTFITDAVRRRIAEQARREEGLAFVATFAREERATPEEMRELLARWGISPVQGATRSGTTKARSNQTRRSRSVRARNTHARR